MTSPSKKCAIYTRKSSEEGLEQDFNSLDAQREACAAFITSQKAEGWVAIKEHYDDGGFSGGNTERPGLQRLLHDIQSGKVNIVVVYKIDRLTRSLMDFSKLVEATIYERRQLYSLVILDTLFYQIKWYPAVFLTYVLKVKLFNQLYCITSNYSNAPYKQGLHSLFPFLTQLYVLRIEKRS